MADFGVIVGLDVSSSAKEIKNEGIPKLQNQLNADAKARSKLIAQIDPKKTAEIIKAQLQGIANSSSIPKINLRVDLTSAKNAVNQFAGDIKKSTQSTQSTDLSKTIFNAEQLDKEGRIYVTKVTDVLERVKNRFLKQGARDVQFLEFRKANDQLRSFIATVDYGAGIIKKFNFEKARIDTGGAKPNNGFVQTDFKSVSDKTMKDYQKTLNFLNTMDKRITDINSKTLNQTKPLQQGTSFYDNYINKLNSVLAVIEKVRVSNNSLTDEEKRNIGLIVNELKNVAKEQQTLAYPPTKLESKSISDSVSKYSAELQTLEQKWKSQGLLVGEFKQKVENLKLSIAHVGEDKNALSAFTTQLSIAKQSASKLQSQLRETSATDNLKTKIKVLTNQLIAYKNANSKAMDSSKKSFNGITFAEEIDSMLIKLKQCADPATYQQIANNFRTVKAEVKSLGLDGSNFIGRLWANMKKFASWMGMTTVMTRATMAVRQLFTTVVELDTELIDLKKTFKGTDSELNQFYYDANKIAKQLGVTTKEVINSASSWSRLGYNTKETATEMAKAASIMKMISPNMTIDTANTGLISIVKAFDEINIANIVDEVISPINEVGNNFAVSNNDIIEGLQHSSAAMKMMGEDLTSTIALFTAGNEILQDASQMGNALRSVSLRVRSFDEETEQFSEDLVGITGKVADLTKAASNNGMGISLFTDETQTQYKDLVVYFGEIADVMDEISAKDKQELLELLFGKNRANAGAALLTNYDQVYKVIDTIKDSAGSAEREINTMKESLDFSINAFKESWTEIGQTAIDRGDIKTIVDMGTSVLNVINEIIKKLGGVPTLVAAIVGSIMAFKNVGELINTPSYALLQLCA